ncbi:hypothetical protein [Haloplanus rubicundus]|uniref:hypothetical protein n=1 Tax=Haloplanus rubicundus TaxID=1547898 RepID=UPI0013005A9B|nr:hypothetical protein [Haloplanus rubicundus]
MDVEVNYRSSDCRIDNGNSPWWVEVEIDSSRGHRSAGTGGVDVEGTLSADPEITVLDGHDSVYVPGNSSGRTLSFKIEQANNSHPPEMEDLDLDLEIDEGCTTEDLKDVRFQRRLSDPP